MQKDYARHFQRIKNAPKRTLLGIAVMLLSGALGGALLHQETLQHSALQLKRDIAAGEKISAGDFRIVAIPRVESVVDRIVNPDDAVNLFAAHTLMSGSLLRPTDLVDHADTRVSVALMIANSTIPPTLTIGSDVGVWQVVDGSAHLLMAHVTVSDLRADERTDSTTLSLALDPADVGAVLGAGDSIRLTLNP
ncbi:MAG: hypothetical protein RL410_1396 [Actinomycetota bacterium]